MSPSLLPLSDRSNREDIDNGGRRGTLFGPLNQQRPARRHHPPRAHRPRFQHRTRAAQHAAAHSRRWKGVGIRAPGCDTSTVPSGSRRISRPCSCTTRWWSRQRDSRLGTSVAPWSAQCSMWWASSSKGGSRSWPAARVDRAPRCLSLAMIPTEHATAVGVVPPALAESSGLEIPRRATCATCADGPRAAGRSVKSFGRWSPARAPRFRRPNSFSDVRV